MPTRFRHAQLHELNAEVAAPQGGLAEEAVGGLEMDGAQGDDGVDRGLQTLGQQGLEQACPRPAGTQREVEAAGAATAEQGEHVDRVAPEILQDFQHHDGVEAAALGEGHAQVFDGKGGVATFYTLGGMRDGIGAQVAAVHLGTVLGEELRHAAEAAAGIQDPQAGHVLHPGEQPSGNRPSPFDDVVLPVVGWAPELDASPEVGDGWRVGGGMGWLLHQKVGPRGPSRRKSISARRRAPAVAVRSSSGSSRTGVVKTKGAPRYTAAVLQRVAGYELLRKIGEGASGIVYRARSPEGELVALKVLRREAQKDLEARARFWREARAASAIHHPNVARVLEAGRFLPDEGEPILYLVMELAGGRDLLQVMTFEDLSLSRVVEIGLQVAAGLGAAHRQGVVHRDLKPGNVRLSSDGSVRILDFGFAKLMEPPDDLESPSEEDLFTSHLGAVIGTAYYMAPEQVRGEAVDARADLFALGVLLYQTISGRLPFVGPSMHEYLEEIEAKEPPPLSHWRPDVPESLESVVHTLLEKDRERRFASAEEVEASLLAVGEELRRRESVGVPEVGVEEEEGEDPPTLRSWLQGLIRRRS